MHSSGNETRTRTGRRPAGAGRGKTNSLVRMRVGFGADAVASA